MSRLDSFIRRLEAQRACLDHAALLVRGCEGAVLELGLGNGRTYDHLRALFPDRDIYVCERRLSPHPDCVPPPERLLLGDMRDTLKDGATALTGRVVLAHLDPGDGDPAAARALAVELAPLLLPLLCTGAVLVSEPPVEHPGLVALEPPPAVARGRYHLYRPLSRPRSA